MKVGDLVKVRAESRKNCLPKYAGTDMECMCWFCFNNSSGVGMILDHGACSIDKDGLRQDTLEWIILFDAGVFAAYDREIKVISESR